MKKIIFFFIIQFFAISKSQKYNPVDTVYTALKQKQIQNYIIANENLFSQKFALLKLSDKKVLKNILSERRKMFEEMIEQKTFFVDESAEKYIQNLLEEIIKKNNLAIPLAQVFLSRETQPNAMSLGSGLFIINISTFCKMNSEDEIKYILSHELSHLMLKHLENTLIRNDNVKNSYTYKNKLKDAKRKSRTIGIEKMMEFVQYYQYDDKKNSRSQEIEADSLGFIYFKTVAENPGNAVETIKKLDSISPLEIIKLEEENYRRFFNTPGLKFKEEWLEIYGEGNYNYSMSKKNALGFNKDSLQTHPEIIERIRLIQNRLEDHSTIKSLQNDDYFLNFKNKMINETLYSHYIFKEYARGLYFALQIESKNSSNEFVKKMKGLFLQKLYHARKDHTYKRFVDDVDYNHQTKSYYQFLAILDHLSVSELQKLSAYYLNN